MACSLEIRLLRNLVTTFSVWNRRRKAQAISAFIDQLGCHQALMVGAVPPQSRLANEGIVEAAVAQGRTSLIGINVSRPPGDFDYPFLIADGCAMPFADDSIEFALSNAVIEHVGGEERQRRFVAEHVRVATSWVITTPNRWFPVEPHTAVVLRHWSSRWRDRQTSFTRLLSRREFQELLPAGAQLRGGWWSPTFTAFYQKGRKAGAPADHLLLGQRRAYTKAA